MNDESINNKFENKPKISTNDIMMEIKNLYVWYNTYRGYAKVVDGINFYIRKGEKIGLVGESGCGKTTTMKTVLQILDSKLIHIPEGEIFIDDKDTLKMTSDELQMFRQKTISMISQEPTAALNPVFTVGEQIYDIIKYSGQYPNIQKNEAKELAIKAIKDVMISDPDRILNTYPHQLSGGMRQRICIAMSLVTPRQLLIADEPGTALDVTVQFQIHRLLHNLVEEKGLSLVMITHSLGVARELVDRIYVMYAGNIVEEAITKSLFEKPAHPYTIGLLDCVPRLSGGGLSTGIYGYVPDYVNPNPGCRFYPRCKFATDECQMSKPPMKRINEDHYVACFNYRN